MNDTSNFIAKVYDTLAGAFNFSNAPPGLFFQMAWPGIPICSADFKNPSGNYDSNIAEEVFSDLANITPIFSKNKFEDSAMDMDDLYDIIISSARPSGVLSSELETNPMFKLFADAQYEYLRSEKGSVSDPNTFYHPCKATPSNWYDENSSQFWPRISIKSEEIKNTDTNSLFVKNNGVKNIEKGVWKLAPSSVITNSISGLLNAKISVDTAKIKTKTLNVMEKKSAVSLINPQQVLKMGNVSPLFAKSSVSTSPLILKMVETGAKLNLQKNFSHEDIAQSSFKAEFIKTVASNPVKYSMPENNFQKNQDTLKKTIVDPIDKDLLLGRPLPVKTRLMMDNFIISNLTSAPASPTTNGFSITFNYCRVNIDRKYFNLAILKMPNWYIYGANENFFSNGSSDDNPGSFPLITTSFIVVSNLKITANWSSEDKANITNGVSFGPFDIRSGSLNQNTLEIPGMQIIAATSKVTPPLAPKNSI